MDEFEGLCEKSVQVWGERAQLLKTVEELGELSKAIARYLIKTGGKKIAYPADSWGIGALTVDLMEEIVDVEIMIGQVKAIFKGHEKLHEICWKMKMDNFQKLLDMEV